MQRGTFRTGTYIALTGSETLQRGAVYEATGSLNGFLMQTLPQDWLVRGLGELYALRHPDIKVLAVELNADGSFRIQVEPLNYEMAGMGIPAAIAAGVVVSILAGMKVEQLFQVVTGTGGGGGPVSGALTLITVVAVVVLGVWVWGQYRQVSQ